MIAAFTAATDDTDRAFMLDLYREYYGLVRKTIYGLTQGAGDLEDLINDSFIKLIDRISVLRTLDSCRLVTYVVYTSRSVAINFIRHNGVQNRRIYYAEDMDRLEVAEPSATVEDLVIQSQGFESMWLAILQLPERQRDLLYFKYILDMDDQAIAKVLAIAPASVRQYLTRARREAKRLMLKEGSAHEE